MMKTRAARWRDARVANFPEIFVDQRVELKVSLSARVERELEYFGTDGEDCI